MGALPEDTSREGCGVGTHGKRRAGSRQLGRLGGDQKNQATFANSLFWPLLRPPILGPRMRAISGISNFRDFKKVSQDRQKSEPRDGNHTKSHLQKSIKMLPKSSKMEPPAMETMPNPAPPRPSVRPSVRPQSNLVIHPLPPDRPHLMRHVLVLIFISIIN